MISKNLLNKTVYIYSVLGLDADRNPTYGSPTELKNVWLDFTSGKTDGNTGAEPSDNGTLYIDCVNSQPQNFVPTIGQKVIWNSKEMSIHSVKECISLDGTKHYECGVY